MAACPKCGRTGIKKQRGERACKRCGPLSPKENFNGER